MEDDRWQPQRLLAGVDLAFDTAEAVARAVFFFDGAILNFGKAFLGRGKGLKLEELWAWTQRSQ